MVVFEGRGGRVSWADCLLGLYIGPGNDQVAADNPGVVKGCWVDAGFKNAAVEQATAISG
ncbi:hypothetical protein ACIRL3_26135 [Streptomyces sp. NPDC102384]|uniref:hypothetical protein n=1 Tax=Streptomyces sp. NPDC102384 TaxID=3366166 RepID=UPI003827FBC7